jgi:hypothetical protein
MAFFENRAVYETKWKNIVQPDRPRTTKWRKRIACWIPKSRNRHSEYVILITFPLQQWLHEQPQCYVIRNLPVSLFFV